MLQLTSHHGFGQRLPFSNARAAGLQTFNRASPNPWVQIGKSHLQGIGSRCLPASLPARLPLCQSRCCCVLCEGPQCSRDDEAIPSPPCLCEGRAVGPKQSLGWCWDCRVPITSGLAMTVWCVWDCRVPIPSGLAMTMAGQGNAAAMTMWRQRQWRKSTDYEQAQALDRLPNYG